MSIEVLLMTEVPDLGAEGAVVKVADGYARNYLFPRNLAAPVNEATRRKLEKARKQREADQKEKTAAARKVVEQLKSASVTLSVKVHEGTKLYGSITAAEIVSALEKQGITLDRRAIQLPDAIRELGVFDVKVELGPGVESTLKVWVVEE